jgi:hypothetical protein
MPAAVVSLVRNFSVSARGYLAAWPPYMVIFISES